MCEEREEEDEERRRHCGVLLLREREAKSGCFMFVYEVVLLAVILKQSGDRVFRAEMYIKYCYIILPKKKYC